MSPERVAIVTGTSAGVGAAVASGLLDDGWFVVGVARRQAPFTNPAYRHVTLDLADLAEQTARLHSELVPHLQQPACRRIGLVNNAAYSGALTPLVRLEPADVHRVYAVNVVAPIWLMGLVVSYSRPETSLRIVNVSSGAGVTPFPGLSAYASSKAALRMAGMCLAKESESAVGMQAPGDFAILSYEPGAVDTDMQRDARELSPDIFPWVDTFRGFASRGLLVPPERPARDIIAFLASAGETGFRERRLQR